MEILPVCVVPFANQSHGLVPGLDLSAGSALALLHSWSAATQADENRGVIETLRNPWSARGPVKEAQKGWGLKDEIR